MSSPLNRNSLHRNEALDGYRGLGCLLVLLGHTQWHGGTILPGALVAMDLFFTLSGFLISGLLLSELKKTGTLSLTRFWKRRAVRLLPAFYIYYGIVAVVYALWRFQPILGTDARVSLLSTAFYGSNWAVARGYDLGVFFVTWSLSLEEQFYFLCPILFLLLFKFFGKKTVMLILGAAIVAINMHRYQLFHAQVANEGIILAFKEVFYRLDTRSDALMIGCLAGVAYNLYGDRIKIGLKWAVPAMALLFGSILFVRDVPVAFHRAEDSLFTEFMVTGGFTFYSVVGMICILHLVQAPHSWLTRWMANRVFVRVGIMSYSIYLWHTTVFGGLDILLAGLNRTPWLWALKTLIRFATAFMVGYASFKWVEFPVLRTLYQKRKFTPIASPA